MKKIIRFLSISLFCLAPLTATQAGPYVQGLIQWVDLDIDDSISLGARAGYSFWEVNALELELTYTSLNQSRTVFVEGSQFDARTKIKIMSILANYKFTYRFTERFAAFAGVGMGATYTNVRVDSQFGRDKGHPVVFTYQGFLGVEYYLLPNLSVHGAYRRMEFEDFNFKVNGQDFTVQGSGSNIFEFGSTYYF